MIESKRSSRKSLEDSRLSRKLNVEPESNVQEIPECKYQLPARRRSRRPGSSGKLQNWWRTTSRRMARSRRSRRKPQKLTAQHVRIPGKPTKTSSLHFSKPRRRLKLSRNVWEEPWKLQWLSAAKRNVPSSVLRPKTSVCAQKYHELKPDLRFLLDFKKESGRQRLSRKGQVHLGRRKNLKYQRRPSQYHPWEFVLESNLLKKNQERNGERRSLAMYGKLGDSSRKVKGTWNASTHRSRKNGRMDCEKSTQLGTPWLCQEGRWRAVSDEKVRMATSFNPRIRKYQPVPGAVLWSQVGMEKPGSQRKK